MVEELTSAVSWVLPIVVPFVIGIVVGAIIKRTIKIIGLVIVLFLVLVSVGITQIPTVDALMAKALQVLPKIRGELGNYINLLPYSSSGFILGLALGLWRG